MTSAGSADAHQFLAGTEVEVRTRYLFSWTRGFDVIAVDDDDHVRLRRRSDGTPLPMPINVEHVRPTHDSRWDQRSDHMPGS